MTRTPHLSPGPHSIGANTSRGHVISKYLCNLVYLCSWLRWCYGRLRVSARAFLRAQLQTIKTFSTCKPCVSFIALVNCKSFECARTAVDIWNLFSHGHALAWNSKWFHTTNCGAGVYSIAGTIMSIAAMDICARWLGVKISWCHNFAKICHWLATLVKDESPRTLTMVGHAAISVQNDTAHPQIKLNQGKISY